MWKPIFFFCLVALALAAPLVANMALINVLILVGVGTIFVMGYNLLWGQAGLISFGHAAYFAFGAAMTIHMMQAIDRGSSFPTPLLPLVGGVSSFLLGLVAGWFATIRTGVYFVMITVAIAELANAIAARWDSVFGGEGGLLSVRNDWGPFTFQSLVSVYYFTVAWAVLVIGFLWWVQNSPLGVVIRGIRERTERVAFLGYNVHLLKTLVFALSTGIAGMAGALLAFSNESTNVTLFQGHLSTQVVIYTIVGGAQVFLGPALGAMLTTLFDYYVANLTHYWPLYMAVLFIVIVSFVPHGITGIALDFFVKLRNREPLNLAKRGLVFAGSISMAVAFVLTTELIGTVMTPAYSALAASSGQSWPPIDALGIAWMPSSPLTLIVVFGLYLLGWILLRHTIPSARRNWTRLIASLSGRKGGTQ